MALNGFFDFFQKGKVRIFYHYAAVTYFTDKDVRLCRKRFYDSRRLDQRKSLLTAQYVTVCTNKLAPV